MKKSKTHKSNPNASMKPVLIMTSDSDVKCDVRKNFTNHWIFKEVFYEFIVENINTWDPHPIQIPNLETVQKSYTVLAEGERGPQIAEHFNSICLQFSLKAKHKETIKVLQNFIQTSLSKVINEGRVGADIESAYDVVYHKKKLKKSNMKLLLEI